MKISNVFLLLQACSSLYELPAYSTGFWGLSCLIVHNKYLRADLCCFLACPAVLASIWVRLVWSVGAREGLQTVTHPSSLV